MSSSESASTQRLASNRFAVLAVRSGENTDKVRRRLQALADQYGAHSPHVLNRSDTVLTFAGVLPEVNVWRCALSLREQLLGEVPTRIACGVADRDPGGAGELPAALASLLARAPLGYVLALDPIAAALPEDERADAQEWLLREPADARALVFPPPTNPSPTGELSVFKQEALPEFPRLVMPVRDQRSSRGRAGYAAHAETDGAFPDLKRAREQGAVSPLQVPELSRLALITAPPWTGKSFVAKTMCDLLPGVNRLVHLTDLENPDATGSVPPMWRRWRDSERELVWVVDAVDEALHRGETLQPILGHLEGLNDDQRARLRLILFTRDDDTRDRVRKLTPELREVLGSELTEYELLPVDRKEAVCSLGKDGEARLERALGVLQAAGLRDWATHIPLLHAAANADRGMSPEALRDELLESLCTEDEARSRNASRALLDLASRVAAALLVSQAAGIGDDQAGSPAASLLLRSKDEKQAFRDLTQSGPLLVRTRDGYRFRQEHAKELLAARGLKHLRHATLRRLLTDQHGRLRDDLTELAKQLVLTKPELKETLQRWQEAKVRPWPPEKAQERLRKAEQALATGAFANLSMREPGRFEHRETLAYLLERVSDDAAPVDARKLFLRIADANEWTDFVPCAQSIALRRNLPEALRKIAAQLVAAHGDRQARRGLSAILHETSEDTAGLRALVLSVLLKDGEDPLAVARQMPAPEPGVVDHRAMLRNAIEHRLTVEHARVILDARDGNGDLPPKIAGELEERALDLLLDQALPPPEDRKRIVDRALVHDREGYELLHRLQRKLQEHEGWRRAFYLQFHARPKKHWFLRLSPEDAAWLFGEAEAGRAPPSTLRELFALSEWADATLRLRIEEYLRRQHASEYEAWVTQRGERSRQEAEWLAEEAELARAAAEEPPPPWLGDLVEQVIASEEPPGQRLAQLGFLCFDERPARYVTGTFRDLPFELKQRAIEHVQALLTSAEPTPLPLNSGPYPAAIRYEADAFRAAVTWDDPASWLRAERVERWLPAVLFTSDHEHLETVQRCLKEHPEASTRAAVTALDCMARAGTFPSFVGSLPDRLWEQAALRCAVRGLIEAPFVAEDVRAQLLRVLADRDWSSETRKLVDNCMRSQERPLRLAAVASLVLREPEQVVSHLDPAWSDAELYSALEPLNPWNRKGRKTFEQWPKRAVADLLCELASRELPEARRASFVWVGPREHLRDLRDRLLDRLAQWAAEDPDQDESELLQKLEGVRPGWADDLRKAKNTATVARLLEDRVAPLPTLRDVASALDGSRLLRFRNVDDFAEALLECIEQIARNSKEDIDLFASRPRPHEKSLQSYVLRRLRDLLSQSEPANVVFTPREPKSGREQPDILALAVAYDDSELEVPIEIKWSDNNGVTSDLRDQLVQRYLLGSPARTRGVYLVGFSGLGARAAQGSPFERMGALQQRLEQEAQAQERAHPELRIDVRLLNLFLPTVSQQRKRVAPRLGARAPAASARRHRTK